MTFGIADTFTESLAKLTGDEQKAAKVTAMDLQMNPAQPGLQFHKLDKAKDKSFWSVRVNRDIRLIVHRTESNLLLCYVDHHDDAYRWAERRKIERHPTTGVIQLVEIRERVQEIVVPKYVEEARPAPAPARAAKPVFGGVTDDELLRYGVPPEWLADVRSATQDSLLELTEHLPREAGEALFDLAFGIKPKVPEPVPAGRSGFDHPDARRRFRLVADAGELERALEYPWERWMVFLHPDQQDLVERRFNGPARVAGSAGTGKTVVALHRAAFLARTNPQARVLLSTFSETLATALRGKTDVLLSKEPAVRERVEVHALDTVAQQLFTAAFGNAQIADDALVRQRIQDAALGVPGHRYKERFLRGEWAEVVDAWQLRTWEDYRDVSRLGRKTRLGEKQRQVVWQILDRVIRELESRGLVTAASVLARVTDHLRQHGGSPYTFVVIDEAQDISVPQLRFLAALVGSKPNGLFFTGDQGQRIFQAPFSWKSLGVDVRGRSQVLRINYRTSHQIRRQADRLLPGSVADVDGLQEQRDRTISVFNGPEPTVVVTQGQDGETRIVAEWLKARRGEGIRPQEIGVFVRTDAQLPRARQAVEQAGMKPVVLDETLQSQREAVCVMTMHLAKGLEFRAVVVMACDDDVIPLQERLELVADDADLEEVYDTERHLLYVACTRARDALLVTGVSPESEFLSDMRGGPVAPLNPSPR
jgi:superfamily I DNA/RNA helicase/mRNA-degrading endonuclease YafQ of YafQ-DinJ toxin-antitoxin module